MENLKLLIDRLNNLSFFERLFSWNKIRVMLVNAMGDFQSLLANYTSVKEDKVNLIQENSRLVNEVNHLIEDKARLDAEVTTLNGNILNKDSSILDLNKQLSTATAELKSLEQKFTDQTIEINRINDSVEPITKENTDLKEEKAGYLKSIENLNAVNTRLDKELSAEKLVNSSQADAIKNLTKRVTEFETEAQSRTRQHEENMASLKAIQDRVTADRQQELDEAEQKRLDYLKDLKNTWSEHEVLVKNQMKAICQRNTIDYIEQVPFKGNPDNTVKIAEEFVIFDAKSPSGDNLDNFPTYLKEQTEKVKKYANEQSVKKDIFLVVPTNTLHTIKQFSYNLGNYSVYILSVDGLEPVLQCLKKIEAYHFVDQLHPEERENICRIIGKFGHLAKRRIQIDTFFIKEMLELAYKCENDLPDDILEQAKVFEKAEKLNPPTERRSKVIDLQKLTKDSVQLESEVSARIVIDNAVVAEELNKLPLDK